MCVCVCVCQEDAGEFSLGVCCSEELRGETPGREDSPSDLGEPELDPGGEAKTRDEKGFGRLAALLSVVMMLTLHSTSFIVWRRDNCHFWSTYLATNFRHYFK